MEPARTPKHAVATELLRTAIAQYIAGGADFAALHLAAGAEEVLSVYARSIKTEDGIPFVPAYDSIKNAAVALAGASVRKDLKAEHDAIASLMNEAKDAVEHKFGVKDEAAAFVAREEAAEVIDRAITTYLQVQAILRLSELPLIAEFDNMRRTERSE